jgi:hypothetical protein
MPLISMPGPIFTPKYTLVAELPHGEGADSFTKYSITANLVQHTFPATTQRKDSGKGSPVYHIQSASAYGRQLMRRPPAVFVFSSEGILT